LNSILGGLGFQAGKRILEFLENWCTAWWYMCATRR